MVSNDNKSPEKLALEEKDRRTNLKKFCDSILQKIRALDNNSGYRAIWELCQNARDLSDCAIIRISLYDNTLTFAHKGKPFSEDSLLSLVKQVSSEEKENDDTAGQFGTGFLTTHIFSRKFYLNGSFRTETNKVFDISNFEIDRSEDDINRFIDKMGEQIEAVFQLLETPETQIREWTELIYPLNERSREIALKAMRVSERMLPYVLVLNDKIKEITLVHHPVKNATFTKGYPYKENDLNVVDIKVTTPKRESIVHIYYLEEGNSKIILPLSDAYTASKANDISKIFVWFPLLGTEQWGINFIYHSTFYPLETRGGIVLPCDNANVKLQYEYNEKVLQDMNTLLYNYLLSHVASIDNAIELAKIDFSCTAEDSKTKAFFKSQQDQWTSAFRTLPLIDTPFGRKSLDDGVKILNEDICSFFANDDNRAKYFDPFYEYASLVAILPNKEECLRWSEIIHKWGLLDESSHVIDLVSVAQKVTRTSNYAKLHYLLEIIVSCKHTQLFETLSLIPNREGELRSIANLRDGRNIPDELYQRVLAIAPTEMQKLVHPDFADICTLTEYTRDQVKQAVLKINDSKKSDTIRQGICFTSEYMTALRSYVSIYSTEIPTSNNHRHRVMQSLASLKGFDYKTCYIPKVDEKEEDYCQSAFIFLLESELLEISIIAKNQPDWLKENKAKLLYLINNVSNIKDAEYAPRLLGSNGYAVIPNQLGVLCKLETLRIRENDILDELADLYCKVKKTELRDTWVDNDFARFVPIDRTDKVKDIASTIESSLMEEYENSRYTVVNSLIIDIIQKIESKTPDALIWKNWFKRIDEKKADLNWHMVPEASKPSFYRLMKVANNKSLLEDLADLSESANMLTQFKDFLQKFKQKAAEFKFKHDLGKHIEDLVRSRLKDALNERLSFAPTIEDQQSGQDIVVSFDKKEIFFIECKAKWNFSEPAHMSKLQIQQACRERDRYALCAVDLTKFDSLYHSFSHSMDELKNHIHVHLNIAEELGEQVKPLLEMKEEISEEHITISTQYQSNIPKKIFVNNIGFEALLDAIIKNINNE